MVLGDGAIRAVVFDYGSTLIEFGARQIEACDRALGRVLERLYGEMDFEGLRKIRNADRRAPYERGFRENDMRQISANLVRGLYGVEPTAAALRAILEVRFSAFVDAVETPEYASALLSELSERYRLGLLSNYPDGDALRASLKKIGWEGYFDAVVVSGDVGRVKPHALPFKRVLERLGVAASEAVYVGDNWLGDVQGARRAGMRVAWTVQFDTPERFERRPGDLEPDVTIGHLTELREYL